MKTFIEITEEIKSASDEMLSSLQNDVLADSEKAEWYGYIRALRDIAYFMGVSKQTKAQENLAKAIEIVIPKTHVERSEGGVNQ